LHHFLTSPWQSHAFQQQRLRLIWETGDREIVLVIDDTGDRKRGITLITMKRQYIGNLGKIENGIVAVTAYGVVDHITLPCCLKSINRKSASRLWMSTAASQIAR